MKTGSLLARGLSLFAPKFLTDTGRTLALYFFMAFSVCVGAGSALVSVAWSRTGVTEGIGWAFLAVAICCGLMLHTSSRYLFVAAPALVGAAAIFLGAAKRSATPSDDMVTLAIIATVAAVAVVWLVIDEHRIPLATGLIICLAGFVLLLETFRFQDPLVAVAVLGFSLFAVLQSAIKYVRHATDVEY